MFIRRDSYVQQLVDRMGNGMIKVVTGIRRCGKTFLLFDLFVDYLHRQGVADDHIIEVSLDSEEDRAYRDPAELSRYLRSRITSRTDEFYVLIDEVQYAISDAEMRGTEPPRLYGVLNGLLKMRNVDVYVTGSNSKFLSTDVLTEFRGRGDEVRVRPLSFAEFMQAFDGDVAHGWAEYIVYGGMPLIVGMKTDEQKSRYLENLFAETYLKDIIAHNHIRKTQELDDLINIVASSIGSLTNPSKIEATFKSVMHSSISVNTITTFLDYLKDAFIIEEAQRYDIKGRKYIGSPKKYYFEDIGLRNARLEFRQIEPTHIMENIVYNELRTRGYSVDVGQVRQRQHSQGRESTAQLEVDFVANLGSRRYYIQSAYQLPTPEKTAQEKASLLGIADSFTKIVLVHDVMKPFRDDHGILTMSVYDFLLDPTLLAAA